MSKKYPTEVTKLLQLAFPKFSKIQLSMANNPEYGIDISPDAKRWLNRMKIEEEISEVGLTADEQAIVQGYVVDHMEDITNYIIWRALNKYEEKPMQGMP